jgi:CRISPR-associated protein Csc1
MSKVINLEEAGYSFLEGRLYNHDSLWFSSTEIAKVSSTWPVIHNYALSYSLAQYSHGLSKGSYPHYEEDLASMPLYTTPAICSSVTRTAITLNAVDDLTLRTDAGGKINTPNLGKRVVVDPYFELLREGRRLEGGYNFFCFVRGGYCPPSVTRLGKKGCPVRIYWRRIEFPLAFFREEAVVPVHPINPLDISGDVLSYEPIILPPHMLFRRAEICRDWFVNTDGRMVLLPKRVRESLEHT